MRSTTTLVVATIIATVISAALFVPASGIVYLEWMGTYETGVYDEGAAETNAYDPATRSIYTANADSGLIDVISIVDPTNPTLISTLNSTYLLSLPRVGRQDFVVDSVQGVAAANGIVVIAVRADPIEDNGLLLFVDSLTEQVLTTVDAGSHPEAISISKDARFVACANEGSWEYNDGTDPVGSITLVEISGNREIGLTVVDSNTYDFSEFGAEDVAAKGVRLFGPNADNVAADLEPEGTAFSDDGKTLFVVFQDNNGIASFDVESRAWNFIDGLSYPTAFADVSDDDQISIQNNWEGVTVAMMNQPDGVTSIQINGATYVLTANEGHSRDEDDFTEEVRFGDVGSDCPNNDFLIQDDQLGRLKVTTATPAEMVTLSDGSEVFKCDTITTFGSRSFTVFRVDDNGVEQVFDSGSDFENKTATLNPDFFNSNDDENSFDHRSDDKGPEPECIAVGTLSSGRQVVFVGLERVGGIMVYDISDPTAPKFNDFFNRRNFGDVDIEIQVDEPDQFTGNSLDVGPEGIQFISAAISPICADLIAVSNAITGTTTIFKVVDDPNSSTPRSVDGSCNTAVDPTSCDMYNTTLNPKTKADVTECPADPPSCNSETCGSYTEFGCGCDFNCAATDLGDCCPDVDTCFADTCSVRGDCNADGNVDTFDVSLLQRTIASGKVTSPCIFLSCDFNNDGEITEEDVKLLVEIVIA